MFGHRGWIAGKAVVVSVSYDKRLWQNSAAETFLMDYVLDVTPSEGSPFRVQVAARILSPDPAMGDEVNVRCDPHKKKAVFDLEGDPRFDQKLIKAKQKADHDALLAAPPGTSPTSSDHAQEVEAARAALEARARRLGLSMRGRAAAPKWVLPAKCPNCGASVDQATKSFETSPYCDFCQEPLPVTAAPVTPPAG